MNQFSSILEENNKSVLAEQTKLMIEQHKMNKMITDIANNKPYNMNNNITNNQTNNQQFNLNMFLNETCKDAMNLSDFLENLNVSMEDMEKTGELGFAKGMSRIIMNNLNAIDVCKRPIHCSDVKRETLYVKNNGVWEKETEDRKRTKEIIYKASRLNLKELLKWRDLPRNKGYDKSDHTKNDEFTNLVMEINKMREEEFDKIITSVSKHVAIDKEKVKMSGYLN
jgi:glutaredoxin-related protein